MKVVFRVDASQKIGTGHVIRCLTLANELRRRGANVIFIVRDMLGAMSSYLRQGGFEVHILARLNHDGISFNGINSLEQKKIELMISLNTPIFDHIAVVGAEAVGTCHRLQIVGNDFLASNSKFI